MSNAFPTEFELLLVTQHEGTVHAVLQTDKIADTKIEARFFKELEQLASIAGSTVLLDLRSLRFVEGTVPGKLRKLADDLRKADGTLTVLAASNICEVLRLLQLDRSFRINDTPNDSKPA